MKIKVKLHGNQKMPEIIEKGDWIDLSTDQDVELLGPIAKTLKRKTHEDTEERFRDVRFYERYIPLNISMELPEGYEAIINPRSSTYRKWGIIFSNHQGVIDNSYSSNNDIWGLSVIPFKKTIIPAGTRIAQFRIQLSQKSTIWQKIKWLFSNKIEFIQVDDLDNPTRGGWGSTGI